MTWEVESVQFGIFIAAPLPTTADAIWKRVIKRPLESYQTINAGVSNASGTVGFDNVNLQVQPSRVDLVYLGKPVTVPSEGIQPFFLKDVDASLKNGITRIAQIGAAATITRVTLVVQSFIVVSSEAEASNELRKKVPQLGLDHRYEDINFQVNVRIPSNVHNGMEYNRLCRWFTGQKVMVQTQVVLGTVSGGAVRAAVEILDLNTPAGSIIKSTSLKPTFAELKSLYDDIKTGGSSVL